MKLYLVRMPSDVQRNGTSKYDLFSFYYWKTAIPLKDDEAMLDSGIHTLVDKGAGKGKDLNSYIDSYIEYINRHDIKTFVNLDLYDKSYDYVCDLDARIEQETGKIPIKVWHFEYGMRVKTLEHFMQNSGEWVAYGGHLNSVHFETELSLFNYYAKLYGKKVHVLGSWRDVVLDGDNGYYSADSSGWVKRALFGEKIGLVEGKKGKMVIKTVGKFDKSVASKDAISANFKEIVKAQRYFDTGAT